MNLANFRGKPDEMLKIPIDLSGFVGLKNVKKKQLLPFIFMDFLLRQLRINTTFGSP
jgi:hypothetical protein